MARLIKAEIYKLRKRSMTYILLLILIGLIALIMSISQAVALNSSTVTTVTNGVSSTQVVQGVAANVHFLHDAITSTIAMLGGLIGVVLAVVLIANGLGSEYGWNTMRPYLLCSESRAKVFTSKLIADAIFVVAGMIIGVYRRNFAGRIIHGNKGVLLEPGCQPDEFYRPSITEFRAGFLCDIALWAASFSVRDIGTVDGGRHRLRHRGFSFRDNHHRIAVNRSRLAGKNTELFAQYQYPEDQLSGAIIRRCNN